MVAENQANHVRQVVRLSNNETSSQRLAQLGCNVEGPDVARAFCFSDRCDRHLSGRRMDAILDPF